MLKLAQLRLEITMYGLLLAIIYLSFISLGLPDSLIGSAWPVMHVDLSVSVASAGVITIIISAGTVISSLFSAFLIKKIGTGLVTAISVGMTALALLGFSFATAYWQLCVLAIPYGLGAGAVDAALNNYVALNYNAKHLNWLHCFWGVGAAISPYIMSFALTKGLGWNNGFRIVFYIQIALTAILLFALPLWKKAKKGSGFQPISQFDDLEYKKVSNTLPKNADMQNQAQFEDLQPQNVQIEQQKKKNFFSVFKIKGVWLVLVAFFAYCALEQTTGLWATSYLVQYRGVEPTVAAKFASFFYIGITVGRGLAGIFADKIGDRTLIRVGSGVILVGILLVALPFKSTIPSLVGLIVIGLGCAPIYPAIIHSTPTNFGKDKSQSVIGLQMAFAYIGITAMPPLFGVIAQYINIGLYWVYILVFTALMIVMMEILNAIIKKKRISNQVNL